MLGLLRLYAIDKQISMNSVLHESFLQLVRLGIGTDTNLNDNHNQNLFEGVDWVQMKALADSQGLSAVVLDGIDNLGSQSSKSLKNIQENQSRISELENSTSKNAKDSQLATVPQLSTLNPQLKLEWIGEVLQGEQTYKLHQEVATDMANLFHRNGIRTYVLKGRIVAECYPKPNHRVSVDLDCFLLPDKGDFDAWALGNDLIRAKHFEVGDDFYKNSAFKLPGLTVENHQFLTPFRGNERLEKLEKFFQEQFKEFNGLNVQELENSRIEGTWLYRPPVMVSALFLIEHAYSHFLHEGLTWRMVLDWVLFSKKHKAEIDWASFEACVDEFGFRKFYDVFNAIGMETFNDNENDNFGSPDGSKSFKNLQENNSISRISELENSTSKDSKGAKLNRMMLNDIWAPLDLHETLHGVKAKFQLAGNYWRARWKYKYFTDMTWMRALYEWVSGAAFDRHPTLE